jgi:hypothetical protein
VSIASDALLKETVARLSKLEQRVFTLEHTQTLSHGPGIDKVMGEIKALKARMGKQAKAEQVDKVEQT